MDHMISAKKKALMALIKKMRGLEVEGLGDDSDAKQMKGNMQEGEDSGDEVVELDAYMPDEPSPEDEPVSLADEKKSFMKRGSRLPTKTKTKAMMMMATGKSKSAKK